MFFSLSIDKDLEGSAIRIGAIIEIFRSCQFALNLNLMNFCSLELLSVTVVTTVTWA